MKIFLRHKMISALFAVAFVTLAAASFGFDSSRINGGDDTKPKKDSLKTDVVTIETTINGEDVKYKAEFSDGKLKTLYKNGVKLNEDDFKKEKKKFLKRLNKLNHKNQSSNTEFTRVFPDEFDIDVDIDMDKIHKDVIKMKKKFSMIDSLNLSNLDSLNNKMKKFHIVINDDFEAALNESTNKPVRKFKRFHISPPNFTCKIEIDLDDVEKELEEANEELEEANIELKESQIRLDNLKKELIKDGLIDKESDEIKIEIEDDEITVNDKPIPDNLKEKYKKLLDDKK